MNVKSGTFSIGCYMARPWAGCLHMCDLELDNESENYSSVMHSYIPTFPHFHIPTFSHSHTPTGISTSLDTSMGDLSQARKRCLVSPHSPMETSGGLWYVQTGMLSATC